MHDNVGQMLVYANMQLNSIEKKVNEDLKPKVKDASSILKDSLNEVRALSRSLNNDVVLNAGLESSLKAEINRLQRLKFESSKLISNGEKRDISEKKHEIILFRILQEFFSNSAKYSEANEIKVILDYYEDKLLITASDNGKGFDMNSVKKGSGLINMQSRAELIKAEFSINSEINKGVTLQVCYPFN